MAFFNFAFMRMSDTLEDAWRTGKLGQVEQLLTEQITKQKPTHDAYANRAIVRARLQNWKDVLTDAQKSIDIQPSIIGYIAKSIALAKKGDKRAMRQNLDLAFTHCQGNRELESALVLIKFVILFLAGQHRDALDRVSDLIRASPGKTTSASLIHTQMSVLLAESAIQKNDYDGAIRLLQECSPSRPFQRTPPLSTISLITGWQLESVRSKFYDVKLRALHSLGRTKEAAEVVQDMLTSPGGSA